MIDKDLNPQAKSIMSSFFWKFGERITAQLVSLIVSIILARILSPDDYGAIALIMVFITVANVFVSNGFGNALIQKKNADDLDFSSVFYINIAMSLAIYVLLFLCAPLLADFYQMPVLCPALRVLSVRIPIAAVNSIQQAYVSRNMMFKKFFWSTLFGTAVSGIVGIIMAYNGFGIWALVWQYIINVCTDTVVLWFTVKWRPIPACSFERAKPLIKYGWKLLVSAVLDTIYTQLRSLIIGKMYTKSDLAYYNQGEKYPQTLSVNINSSIGSVLLPVMSQAQDDMEKVKKFTRRAIQVSSYVIWPMMVGVAVIAEPLIRILLTDKWLPCVPFLRICCFTYGVWPIHTANLQALNAIGRSDIFLKLEIAKKTIGIIALLISIRFGPLAIAKSSIILCIINAFINSFPNRKLLNYIFREQFSDLLSPFILSVLMAAVIFPISKTGLGDLAVILLQIVCGIIIYLLGSIISKQKGFAYICGFIKEKGN